MIGYNGQQAEHPEANVSTIDPNSKPVGYGGFGVKKPELKRPETGSAPPEVPKEAFDQGSSEPASLIKPTKFKAADPKVTGKKISTGKALVLGGLAATAGIVGTAAVMNTPADTVETEMNRQQQRAAENSQWLQEHASQEGGGFKVQMHPFMPVEVEATSAEQIVARLDQGETVKYYESEADIPVEVKSYEDLKDLKSDVLARKAKAAWQRTKEGIKDEVDGIGEDFKEAGREIKDAWNDAMGEIFGGN